MQSSVSEDPLQTPADISLFARADPVAVFSVLADLHHRAIFLPSVVSVEVVGSPVVQKGTVFREFRRPGYQVLAGQYVITDFLPPEYFSITRALFGCRLKAAITLRTVLDGCAIECRTTAGSMPWLMPLAHLLKKKWTRRLERDLEDMARYVESRANPTWRARYSGFDGIDKT